VQPLLNKIVWVTGAGSGIGEAAALTLAKAGGAVVLTGRRREPLETVAHRIRAEGGTAHVEPGDLMDPAQCWSAARARKAPSSSPTMTRFGTAC
jgi:NADP-dependent 3-hydroxy acid dehydrogenase YdfG